jgi:hypothetical protein
MDWPPQIKRAIVDAKVLLLVFSSNSNVSDDVFREVYLAATYKKIILLLKIDDSELSDSLEYYMGSVHWLDAMTPPLEARLAEVSTLVPRLLETVDAAEMSRMPQPRARESVDSAPPVSTAKTEDRNIYVSYARNDDLPPLESDGKGFVTTLIASLGHYLTELGPPNPQIWCDLGAIDQGDSFGATADRALADADILLVVLSNNWIHSAYCKRELELFRRRHEDESAEQLSRRVIVVAKNHLDIAARPRLLQGQVGYAFFREDESGRYQELFRAGKSDGAFYGKVQALARDLWGRAKQ